MLFFLFTSIANSSDVIMHYDDYEGHENYWARTPDVVICSSQTVFNKSDVDFVAKEVWKEKIGKVTTRKSCDHNIERGKIKILDGKHLNPFELGRTRLIYDELIVDGKVVERYKGSVIYLDKNINSIKLLIHEMGHAFGYGHYEKAHDIMNSN